MYGLVFFNNNPTIAQQLILLSLVVDGEDGNGL